MGGKKLIFDDPVLSLVVVHKGVADLTRFRVFFQQAHRVRDLPALVLGEEEYLVGALDEYLLLGPEATDVSNLLEHLVVLEAQDDDLVLQDGELEDSVEPGA